MYFHKPSLVSHVKEGDIQRVVEQYRMQTQSVVCGVRWSLRTGVAEIAARLHLFALARLSLCWYGAGLD